MAAHGTETCSECGGYLKALGTLGSRFYSQCQDCGQQHGTDKNNTLDDVLNSTVFDYSEN